MHDHCRPRKFQFLHRLVQLHLIASSDLHLSHQTLRRLSSHQQFDLLSLELALGVLHILHELFQRRVLRHTDRLLLSRQSQPHATR